MNAKDFLAAFKFVQDQKGGGPVRMVGVWRIWPEYGRESLHVQGEADPSEIKRAFHPIPNFKTKDAQDAFQNYEGARSRRKFEQSLLPS